MRKLRTDLLPFISLVWISPRLLVAGGHDCVPVMFNISDNHDLELGDRFESSDATEEASDTVGAMKMFRARDRLGEQDIKSYNLPSTHQNMITQLSIMTRYQDHVVMSSSGADGRICCWRINIT